MLSRRDLLKVGALTAGAVMLPVGRHAATAKDSSPRVEPFTQEFRVPRVAVPTSRSATSDYYDITARAVDAEILPGRSTRVWAYDGLVPGPTIHATEGRRVVVRHRNGLQGVQHVWSPKAHHDHMKPNGSLSVHTHGAVVDGASDGHPEDIIVPGDAKEYGFPNRSFEFPLDGGGVGLAEQCARTQWYHDHNMLTTGQNVYMGLAGFYLLHDTASSRTWETSQVLPQEEYDVPLLISDRKFGADGQFLFDWPASSNNGILGDTILVNGVVQPFLPVNRAKYRFRILNGSSGRQYDLRLSNGMSFQVIATEGGYLSEPVTTTSLLVAQAERYEIVIDFARVPAGTRMVLRNAIGEQARTASVMQFRVMSRSVDSGTVPRTLRQIERIPVREAAVRRKFTFARNGGQWTINGATWDPERIDAAPRAGSTEIWTVENKSGGWVHPIHLHLLNFQILSRTRREVAAYERGWKETVFLGPNESADLIMRWPDVPADVRHDVDNRSTRLRDHYVFHCHNLQHEDDDMMNQIQVRPRA